MELGTVLFMLTIGEDPQAEGMERGEFHRSYRHKGLVLFTFLNTFFNKVHEV